jgi:hypothetical protein
VVYLHLQDIFPLEQAYISPYPLAGDHEDLAVEGYMVRSDEQARNSASPSSLLADPYLYYLLSRECLVFWYDLHPSLKLDEEVMGFALAAVR